MRSHSTDTQINMASNIQKFFTEFFNKLEPSDWLQILIAFIALFGPYLFEFFKTQYFTPRIKIYFTRRPNEDCIKDKRLLLVFSNVRGKRPLIEPIIYLSDIRRKTKKLSGGYEKYDWASPSKHQRPYQLRCVNKDIPEYWNPDQILVNDFEYFELGRFLTNTNRKRLIFCSKNFDNDTILEMSMDVALPNELFSLEPGEYRFNLKILGSNNFSEEFYVFMDWNGSYTDILNNPNDPELLNFKFHKKLF